jgi:hypothetical protein
VSVCNTVGPVFVLRKHFCPLCSLISDAILEEINKRKSMINSCRKMAQSTANFYCTRRHIQWTGDNSSIVTFYMYPHLNWCHYLLEAWQLNILCGKSTFFARNERQHLKKGCWYCKTSFITYWEVFSEDATPA